MLDGGRRAIDDSAHVNIIRLSQNPKKVATPVPAPQLADGGFGFIIYLNLRISSYDSSLQ